MYRIIIPIVLLLFLTGCEKTIDLEQSQDRNGVVYEVNADNPFTGKVTGIYKNGQVKYQGKYKDGYLNGVATGWYENGLKQYEENYISGKIDGLITVWNKNGEVRYKKQLKSKNTINGLLINEHIMMNDDFNSLFSNDGQPFLSPNSNITFSGVVITGNMKMVFVDGYPIYGTLFHENGNQRTELVFQTGTYDDVEIKEWDEKGNIISEGTNKNGEIHSGTKYEYYGDGKKKSEGNYKEGIEDGQYIKWYENGQKSVEGNYKEGHQDGLWTSWYENGKKEEEGNYKEGIEDGQYIKWSENGKEEEEGTYENGLTQGEWKYWDSDGNLYETSTYVDGIEQ